MVPRARWLISIDGWRFAMLAIGDGAWLVIIPTALLVREPRTLRGREPPERCFWQWQLTQLPK